MSQMRMPRIGMPSRERRGSLAIAVLLLATAVTSPFAPSAQSTVRGSVCSADGVVMTVAEVGGSPPAIGEGRELAEFRNADRVCGAVWVPAIDEGFVPQGLAMRSETEAVLSGYLVDPSTGEVRGRCAVVTVDVQTGESGRLVDFGARPSAAACHHAGGIAIAPTGEVIVSDDRAFFVFHDTEGLLSEGAARRIDLVGEDFHGSFLAPAYEDGVIWVGTFANSLFDSSPMEPVPVDVILDPATTSIARGESMIPAPRAAQGAGWDGDVLAVVSSSPQCGQVAVTVGGDGRRTYEIGPGAQSVAVAGDRLLVVHEAGAIPHPEAFFPVVADYDLGALRDGAVCLLLPSRDTVLLALMASSTVLALILAVRIRRARTARRPTRAEPTGRGSS